MTKIKLNIILDIIGQFFLEFFISIIIFRCLKIKLITSVIFSVIISSIISFVIFIIQKKIKKKNNLLLSDLQQIENIREQFKMSSLIKIKKYFFNLFLPKYTIENHKKTLILINNKQKIIIYFNFDIETMDEWNLLNIYKTYQNSKTNAIYIFCFKAEKKCYEHIKNFIKIKYKILNINEIYNQIIKPSNIYPEFFVEEIKKNKTNWRVIIDAVFNKSKAKRYFWLGILIFISSFWVPMSIYYLIISAIMLSMAFITKFFYKNNNKSKKEMLFEEIL